MYMSDEDGKMLDGTIGILKHMFEQIRDMPIDEAMRNLSDLGEEKIRRYSRKDRKDTMLIDVVAEDAISIGDGFSGHLDYMLRIYNQTGVIITEECGRMPREIKIEHNTPTIISDPIDGSSYFEDIMARHKENTKTVGKAFDIERETVGEKQAKRHACNTSVTLIKDNTIKYSVVLNLMTGDVFIGYPKGVFTGDIITAGSLKDISKPVCFADPENMSMLCYTRPGRYENNRKGTHLRFFPLHEHSSLATGPIGPLRFTYITKIDGTDDYDIGIIAHNGEKIQEALPNIAMALFSKDQLKAYKLFCDPDNIEARGGKVLTPNLANSLYSDGLIMNTGIKSTFLNNYDYPSEFRDTTAIFSSKNDAALTMFTGMVDRNYAVRIV